MSHTGVSQISCAAGCETVCGVNAILGYARVSTTGQDLDAQLAALSTAGADRQRIFIDALSGSAKTARPGLAAMLDYARPEDTLVVCAIDRLGRSVAEVTRTIAELAERRITLRALREGIDTATPTGRAVAAIMATMAALETRTGLRASRRIPRITPGTAPAGYQAAQAQPRAAAAATPPGGHGRAHT